MMTNSFAANKVANVFAISCWAHGTSFINEYWLGTSINGVTMQRAVHDWFVYAKNSHRYIDAPYPKGCQQATLPSPSLS